MKKTTMLGIATAVAVASSAWFGGLAHGKQTAEKNMTVSRLAEVTTDKMLKANLYVVAGYHASGNDQLLGAVLYKMATLQRDAILEAHPELAQKN